MRGGAVEFWVLIISKLSEMLRKCKLSESVEDPRRATLLYIGLYLEVLRGALGSTRCAKLPNCKKALSKNILLEPVEDPRRGCGRPTGGK